jgi:ribosomal protein S18 acetylase RimI-like enzyme
LHAQICRLSGARLMLAVRRHVQRPAAANIRVALTTDLVAIERCVAEAYQGYTDRIGKRPASMDREFRPLVEAGHVYVYESDGRVIAAMTVASESDHVEVSSVAVSPAAQGRGIGRQLMAKAEQIAVERGLPRLRLYTKTALPELAIYYERLGYRLMERKQDHGYDRVFLEKVLPA